MRPASRLQALLTAAQIVCALSIPLTLIPSLLPTFMLVSLLQKAQQYHSSQSVELFSIALCARDLLLGGCLFCAEMEAVGLLGRMKKSSCFSEKNEAALGRIIACLILAALVALFFGNSIIPFLLQELPVIVTPVQRLLLPLMLLGLALMIRAVQLMMRRTLAHESAEARSLVKKIFSNQHFIFTLLMIFAVLAMAAGAYLGIALGMQRQTAVTVFSAAGMLLWAWAWFVFIRLCLRLRKGESAAAPASGKALTTISRCMAMLALLTFAGALIAAPGSEQAPVFFIIEAILLPGVFLSASLAAQLLQKLLRRRVAAG